jgi:NADPH:quinone reductase-like Zn-dependent oxidoreductase
MMASIMRAVVADRFGEPGVLRLSEAADPEPLAGQYLVRVHAAGVNPIDWKLRRDLLGRVLRPSLPWIPGCELCGTVLRAGPGARRFSAGEQVVAVLDPRAGGASAELAVVDEAATIPRPTPLSPVEAAALPTVALTAMVGFRLGHAAPGARVLVNGAAGGVGHAAVQIAKAEGMHVTAVCSERNVEFVRRLGADQVIDYGATDVLRGEERFDVFFDVIPTTDFWAARNVLAPGGAYVTTSPGPGPAVATALAPVFGRRSRFITFSPKPEEYERMWRMAEDGRLHIHIERTFPFADLAAAHARSESARVRGKLAVVV